MGYGHSFDPWLGNELALGLQAVYTRGLDLKSTTSFVYDKRKPLCGVCNGRSPADDLPIHYFSTLPLGNEHSE